MVVTSSPLYIIVDRSGVVVSEKTINSSLPICLEIIVLKPLSETKLVLLRDLKSTPKSRLYAYSGFKNVFGTTNRPLFSRIFPMSSILGFLNPLDKTVFI